jgi:hypothetical protein
MPQNVRQYGCISKGHDEIIRMLASYENGRGINHPPAQALIEELVLVVREEQTDIGLGVDVIDNASHDGGRVPLTSERWVRHDCGHAADSQPAGVSPGSVDLKHFGMTYEEVASRSDKMRRWWVIPEALAKPVLSTEQRLAPRQAHEREDLNFEFSRELGSSRRPRRES